MIELIAVEVVTLLAEVLPLQAYRIVVLAVVDIDRIVHLPDTFPEESVGLDILTGRFDLVRSIADMVDMSAEELD